MSCQHHKPTADTLASYQRPPNQKGPTQTYTHQENLAQRLRGTLGRLKADVRTAAEKANQDPPPSAPYEGVPPLTAAGASALLAYLTQEHFRGGLLQVVSPDRNGFVNASYAQGLRSANSALQDITGGGPSEYPVQDISGVLESRRHQRELGIIQERVYSNLEDVSQATAEEIRGELLSGVNRGENPNKIARRINERVDAIGKHRSTVIARTEVMNAYGQAKLERLREHNEQLGAAPVSTLHGSWLTSFDESVCAFCRRLQGVELSVSEMLGTRVEFRGQQYRLRTPAHPNGRCDILVRPGSPEGSLSDRLPDSFTILS